MKLRNKSNLYFVIFVFALILAQAYAQVLPTPLGKVFPTQSNKKLQETSKTESSESVSLRNTTTSTLLPSTAIPGYTLLDEITGMWTSWTDPNSFNISPSQALISSPFSAPAGGNALYQNLVGLNSYTGGGTIRLSRSFIFPQVFSSGSKVAFYADFQISGGFYDTSAVEISTYLNGELVEEQVAGADGGYCSIYWPISYPWLNYTVYPSGHSGLVEVSFNAPFDAIYVSVTNFVGYDAQNTTIFDHLMIKDNIPAAVETISAYPPKLWQDSNDSTSGVVFRAETSEDTDVTFTVVPSSGPQIVLGPVPTENKVAKLSWWGYPNMPSGSYTIIAATGDDQKQNTFDVIKTGVDLTGLGKWMKNTKDPSAVLPPFAKAEVCPERNWEELLSLPDGYFAKVAVGDPVSTSSGNFSLPEVDFTLKDRRTFAIARIYNSLEPKVGSFGRGWSSPLLVNLEIAVDRVVFTNSDGSKLRFNKAGSIFTPVSPTDLKLEYNATTGFYTLSHPHGTNWIFNQNGQIVQMLRSCCGQGAADAIIFNYDVSGKLANVTTPSGKSITLAYNANDLITTITDSTGRVFTYSYDTNNNLVSFKDPLNRVAAYAYDEFGFMTSYTKPGNRITEITYVENRVTNIKDPTGAQSTFAWNFDTQKLTLTDFAGVVHEYGFDADWRLNSYAVPSANVTKDFTAANGRLTAQQNSMGYQDGYTYDANGFYVSHTDKLGNITAFEWEPTLRKLARKTDSLGREWSYEWCYRGNLIKQTDPAGNETTYTYDSHNNRTSKTNALGHISRYVYDSTGNYLVQTIDAMGGISSFTYDLRGNLITSTDALGRTTTYEYDLIDRLVKTTYPDGRFTQITYDDAGNIASRVDNLGRVTAYTYDANAKLLTTTRPDGSIPAHAYDTAGRKISSTDALGRVTAYEYDALDNMTKVTYPDQTYQTYSYDTEKQLVSSTDELGNVTAYEYDPIGRMLATIDPAGSRYENQYDAAGRKTSAKDPLGRITAYAYDVLDRVTQTTAPDSTTNTSSYDALGNLLASTNALNQQTVYEYDALNRQVKATWPNGAQFTTTYDAVGQVISETDALGNATTNAYDMAGRRVSTTNALNYVWLYTYDNAGRLVNTTDPMGGVATMAYDIMDRVISEKDALGRITSYEYDNSGKRIAKTDPMGRRSIFGYNLRDRLTQEVDGEGRIVSYGYDSAGRKTSLTDGAGRVWRWAYDNLGRVTAEIDPFGKQVLSSYDAVGNLTLKTNARAQAASYEYDLMNRLVKINYPDATIATFSYDPLGRELVRSGPGGAVAKAYDVAGNMTSESFLSQNKAWNYSFDLLGNRLQAISPENETLNYSYDPLYRLVEINTGNVTETVNYTYDALGRTTAERRVDTITANTFDAVGQILEMKHYSNASSTNILALRQYSYDLAGNRVSMTNENGEVTAYAYDNSNWLTQVVYPNNDVVAYTYNGAGDRTSEQLNSDAPVNYEYDAAGRMIAQGSEPFTYDADGNMLTDHETTYTWNSDNRLIKVAKIGGCKHKKTRRGHGYGHLKHGKGGTSGSEEYSYLPQDWRRISRKLVVGDAGSATASETMFVSIYDGDDESHEYKLSPVNSLELFRSFVNGPGTDDLLFAKYAGISLSMLKDALGSTIVLADTESFPIARVDYDAWGNLQWSGTEAPAPCSVEDLANYLQQMVTSWTFGQTSHDSWNFGRLFASELSPYLYASRRFSDFTGQTFHRNRYYSPALGRFTSKDPIGFNGGMNLYRYADNNPMRWVDPWGLFKYLGTNWIFSIDKGKQAKIGDLEAGNSAWLVKWYGKYVIDANGRGYARPTIDVKKEMDSNCKVGIQTEMGITIYLPNIGEIAGRNVTDENLLKMLAEHEIGHEMMYRLIGERIFKSLEDSVNGKGLTPEEVDAKINEAKLKFYDEINEADSKYHSGNRDRPFFEIDWSGFQK